MKVDRETPRTIVALRRFLEGLLSERRYDAMVPVERKGTALLRGGMALAADPPSWEQVICADALAGWKGTDPRRVLVLDDSVWRGNTLRTTVERVRSRWPSTQIESAAFCVHRDAPADLVDIAYYRGLDDVAYQHCRDAMIYWLQERGSLLLDTEHVEVKVSVANSPREFLGALAGWGRAVVFSSSAGRLNCTVFQENVPERLRHRLPAFASAGSAVCKLRVVSNARPANSFSIIPIWFPSLIQPSHEVSFEHAGIGLERQTNGHQFFHTVGLGLSLYLLVDALRYLRAILGSNMRMDYSVADFSHVRATLPQAEPRRLVEFLNNELATHISAGSAQPGYFDDPGRALLDDLGEAVLLECFDRHQTSGSLLRKRATSDFLKVGVESGNPIARVSAAMDVLIDDAKLLPDIRAVRSENGNALTRVFGPDGEVVAREVVRLALSRGLGLVMDHVEQEVN